MVATWTPKAKQAETWSSEAPALLHTFSHLTFSIRPVFDTGLTAVIWTRRTKQAETWTVS